MIKIATASVIALAALSGAAFAQTAAPKAPTMTPPAATSTTTPSTTAAPSATTAPKATTAAMDPAVDAKFKAADKSGKGFIEGNDLTPYKSVMTQVDTDKDGKISKVEFAAAVKAGIIK